MDRNIQPSSMLWTLLIYLACLLCPPLRNKFKTAILNMAINRQLPAGLFPVYGDLVLNNSRNEKLPIHTTPVQLWRRMTSPQDYAELFMHTIKMDSHAGLKEDLLYCPKVFGRSSEEVAIKRAGYKMNLLIFFSFDVSDELSELISPSEQSTNPDSELNRSEETQKPIKIRNTPDWIPDFDICFDKNARTKARELGLPDNKVRFIIVINGCIVGFEFDGGIGTHEYDVLAEIVKKLHTYENKVWTIESSFLRGSKLRLEKRDPTEFIFFIGDEKWSSPYGMPSIPEICKWVPKSGQMTIQCEEDPAALALVREMCKKSHAVPCD